MLVPVEHVVEELLMFDKHLLGYFGLLSRLELFIDMMQTLLIAEF